MSIKDNEKLLKKFKSYRISGVSLTVIGIALIILGILLLLGIIGRMFGVQPYEMLGSFMAIGGYLLLLFVGPILFFCGVGLLIGSVLIKKRVKVLEES